MKQMICAVMLSSLLFCSCNKKEPQPGAVSTIVSEAAKAMSGVKETVADKPVKAGETGIILPAGSKLRFTADKLEIAVELPGGYAFLSRRLPYTEKTLPVYATYACYCSVLNNACQVFYEDGLGFGCLQSSCSGSCTGKFTYKGYSVDRLINLGDKDSFFNDTDIQEEIKSLTKNVASTEAYGKFTVMGIPFFLVQNEKAFLDKASCDCEGTKACKLKTVSLKGDTSGKKIYYCEGGCNGCELTID